MPVLPTLERLVGRDGAITTAGLCVLCVLAWLYIAAGAGLGMSAWDMTTLALTPHPHVAASAQAMPGMEPQPTIWGVRDWALRLSMWWVMMIAMMTPSAAPAILLHARVYRHARGQGHAAGDHASAELFAGGYFLMWLAFSIAATALQWALERAGIVSGTTMGSQLRWASATLLLAAGLYQLSPLKNACLAHCRSPALFLSRHWRPHALGTLRMGALHGAYCVGCCWMLMVLLFVGGVMNLAWIAALSILVLAEKVLARGRWVGHGAGVVLVCWGLVLLA